jgi:CheY-like chemotaxis protein/two-component sensor histidine kinase
VLVGGIAHDFNNLLGTIAGNADLALMKVDGQSPARAPIERASLASQRAAELVRQLLSYSAKAPVARTEVALNGMIRELTALLEVTIGRRARMHLDLAEPLPLVVGDATQLRQVLLNLVHNAADAIAHVDGEVRIATRVLRGGDADDVRVQLSVRDTGIGIEPEHLERIFEVFYTTKVAGRGLGLSAVRTIADRHQGSITVESLPGHGSTFTLMLPAAEPPTPVESAPLSSLRIEPQRAPSGSVILVVDDERPLLDVLGAFIEEFGDVPLLANSVGEAHATFAEHPEIACALLDLTMPSGGGAVLARAFKAARPEVPMVLMSGFANSDVIEALGSLLDAVIAKPFKPADLQKVLARVLGR